MPLKCHRLLSVSQMSSFDLCCDIPQKSQGHLHGTSIAKVIKTPGHVA